MLRESSDASLLFLNSIAYLFDICAISVTSPPSTSACTYFSSYLLSRFSFWTREERDSDIREDKFLNTFGNNFTIRFSFFLFQVLFFFLFLIFPSRSSVRNFGRKMGRVCDEMCEILFSDRRQTIFRRVDREGIFFTEQKSRIALPGSPLKFEFRAITKRSLVARSRRR